ncbi:MAG: DUF2277 family protein [Caldilineaceae bacterium]
MCRNIPSALQLRPARDRCRDYAARRCSTCARSAYSKASQANQAAFDRAVDEIAAATRSLLDGLVTNAAPRDREVEATKAKRAQRSGLVPTADTAASDGAPSPRLTA